MRISEIRVRGFRNLSETALHPTPGVNVIYGENAQGKTNLIEAVWMCSGMKSFRGAKEPEMPAFGSKQAQICLRYDDGSRMNDIELKIENRRSAVLNGIPLSSPAGLIGKFRAVVFYPSFLSIVQAGPQGRRRFIDAAICQLYPAFAKLLAEYGRLLRQRGALLKDIRMESSLLDMLDVLDLRLAECAEQLTARRLQYLEALTPFADEIYGGISSGREKISFRYIRKGADGDRPYGELLRENRRTDILNRSTGVGPHRDDVEICINGVSARVYGSQGQQRSCALALKLGEASVIRDLTGSSPVTLLDDVMSELDAGRQNYILNHIGDRQVFITCCDPDAVGRLTGGMRVSVRGGVLTEE